MKIKGLLFMLALVLGFQVQQALSTTNGIEPVMSEEFASAADADYAKVIKKEKKGLGKLVSWVKAKVQKFVKKLAQIGGLGDPVDKWFWYWIIGWGGAILLWAILPAILFSGGLGSFSAAWLFTLLGTLLSVLGTVSLIVWLVKKFA